MAGREWAIEPDLEDTDLFALGVEPIHHFVNRFGARTHDDHNLLSFRVADVVEELVLASDSFAEGLHRVDDVACAGFVEGVDGLASLEESVRIL